MHISHSMKLSQNGKNSSNVKVYLIFASHPHINLRFLDAQMLHLKIKNIKEQQCSYNLVQWTMLHVSSFKARCCEFSSSCLTTIFIRKIRKTYQIAREECFSLTVWQWKPAKCLLPFISRRLTSQQTARSSPTFSPNKRKTKRGGFMTKSKRWRHIYTQMIRNMITFKFNSKDPSIPTSMRGHTQSLILCQPRYLDWLVRFPCYYFACTKVITSGVTTSGGCRS